MHDKDLSNGTPGLRTQEEMAEEAALMREAFSKY